MKYYDPPIDGDLDAPQMLVCTDTDNFETWNSQTLRILLWTNVPSKQLTQGFYEWQQTYTILVWIIQHVIEMTKLIMPNAPFSWLGHYK